MNVTRGVERYGMLGAKHSGSLRDRPESPPVPHRNEPASPLQAPHSAWRIGKILPAVHTSTARWPTPSLTGTGLP